MIRRRQRWKVHECETCGRWKSAGVMVGAGVGRHRHFKFVCNDCKRSSDNVRAVDQALSAWEIERGYRTSSQ
jgi:transposase-like protein